MFTPDDLELLADIIAGGWEGAASLDWSRPAGNGVTWSCSETATHIVDTVLAPAFFLASRRQDGYPDGGWSPPPDTPPALLAESLRTVARLTAAVVRGTDPSVRSIIWRRPEPEVRPPEDFPPRAGLELALHAFDVAAGLGIELDLPAELGDRLRRHTHRWPHWGPGFAWRTPTLAGDPWDDLLRASGRS